MRIRVLRGIALTVVALIGTAGLVVSASLTTLVQLTATALIMGGTGMKALGDPHQWGTGTYLEQVNRTYLSGRHLGAGDLKWVPTPEQFWPATGLADISFDTSVARGVLSLNNAILTTPGEKVIVGYSQSANIATREKRNLAELRAQGAVVPSGDELSFVFVANPNRPNGGILARFEGVYIPLLGISFDAATPDDIYRTIDVAREYDLIADFPKYPLNLLADLNALAGYIYLHPNYGSSVIDLNDPATYQSHTAGNTTYYLVHTEHLPLLQPLRDIGFPTPVLDLVEPTLRVLIDLAYDRTPEHMGIPTRAGLIPDIDADQLRSDLSAAAKQGLHQALADLGVETTTPHRDDDAAPPTAPSAPEPAAGPTVAPERSQPARARLRGFDRRPATSHTATSHTAASATTAERAEEPPRSPLQQKRRSDGAPRAATATRADLAHRVHRSEATASPGAAATHRDSKRTAAQGRPQQHQRTGQSDGRQGHTSGTRAG
ncbi:PE-PPE domain-containing protein [Mycobacterium sp. TNTM28]|uniref:PE-PPE domain-containing protein n=1 Tax=[Mycobacterium] fortunisiensis TaxID=2600579 RepID=A0ABS6KMF4_9MYCO|nr:PE-PPE domain-containing protein [[Mycobacterium] fortunisiensis]MBU9764466.1 PE-PPE domain-containing protein [[Mycobacterium] fortunisiensis]